MSLEPMWSFNNFSTTVEYREECFIAEVSDMHPGKGSNPVLLDSFTKYQNGRGANNNSFSLTNCTALAGEVEL